MKRRDVVLTGVLLSIFALDAAAQSLGELARREEERRRQAIPGKQYTNADLPESETTSSVAAASPTANASVAPQAPAAADAKAADGTEKPAGTPDATQTRAREKRDEQYWRNRARELRGHMQQAQTEIDALVARVTELEAMAATSPGASRERDVAAAQLRKRRQNLQSFQEEFQRYEQRAQTSGVPADWLK